MLTKDLISELKSITDRNLLALKKHFKHLNNSQLSWKPNELNWSVSEIFAHLNEYARFYNKHFLFKIDKTKFRPGKEVFISSPLGRSAWKSMKLGNLNNVKRKFRAKRDYDPKFTKLVSGDDVEKFTENQDIMLDILERSNEINIRKAKIPISISKLIRLKFGDALMFVIYHNERHVQQALNLLKHPNFPKK